MATYIVLMNWTDQGVKTAKDTVARAHDATAMIESKGGKIESLYWTSGSYDLIATISAPDDETLAAILLTVGAGGSLRTQTLRAFTEAEISRILDNVS
jgi:uncharacterized protein with GYD domain